MKKKELGKGIRALLSNIDKQVEENPEQLVKELASNTAMINIDTIEVNPFQPRKEFEQGPLEELSESIKVHGLIQPITLRRMGQNRYQLISGERRLRASRMAGLTEVPAYVRIVENDQEMLEMALIENIQREDLNAVEVAFTYQRLIDECKLTHEKLSERVGKNRSSVTNYLRLLKLPPDIQQALKQRKISMGHARALVGVEDLALQLMLLKQITDEDLSVRAVEEIIRSYNQPAGKAAAKSKSKLPAEYQSVQDNLRQYLGSKVLLKRKSNGAGQIVINFGSDADLNRLLDLIEQ
ncbi:MAG: ParB/RepB/Spo0J family partition protein [Bacteroidota bacterium]